MSFTVRMSILGFVLLVALCGLAWEFLVAVPGFNNAQTKLTKISDDNIKKTIDEAATMKDVQAVLPQKPSESNVIKPPKKGGEDDKSMRAMTFIRHDKYNFYHALPWKKPETIVVVYQKVLKNDDELDADPDSFDPLEWRLRTVHFNSEPPKTAQRNVSKDAKNPGDVPTAAGGGGPPPNAGKGGPGGGPGGKKGGKGGKGGGQRPDPETIFKENDKDKDGKLTGDEIPEQMQRFVDRMDEDKDGSITIEEMKAAFARRRESGGRGGRGGPGGGDAKKGGRPSFDDDKKDDVKTEEKADAKTEEKADAKTEEKADAKTEEKADAKSEEKADAKTEEKADAKTEEKADAKTEEKADAKTEEKADAKSEEKVEKVEEKADSNQKVESAKSDEKK